MTNEIWRDVKGYEGLYQVSNLGRVKSLERIDNNNHVVKERILKTANNKGYLRVLLCKDKKRKNLTVHRLVAEAFIPNPENKSCVDHINTIKTDNRVENLRWVTYKENMNNKLTVKKIVLSKKGHTVSIETRKKISENHANTKGGNNPRARKVFCDGMIFSCIKECAEYYDINAGTMRGWLNGNGGKIPQRFKDLGLRYATEEDLKQVA